MRPLFMRVAWSHLGRWYKWGGDDSSGFDCSGYVIECLQSVGLFPDPGDTTAAGLWKMFEDRRIRGATEGALVFWENDAGKVCHVEVCLDNTYSIGARGGKNIKTVDDAIKHNAFVKVRPIDGRALILKGFVDPFKIPPQR
jgi:cell wall-associated NlpC family hydrolase